MLDGTKPTFNGDLTKLADALRRVADEAKEWNSARDTLIQGELVAALREVVSSHLAEVRAEWRREVKSVLARHLLDACTSLGISLAQRAWLGFFDLDALRKAVDPGETLSPSWGVQLLQDSRPILSRGRADASIEDTAFELRARFDGPIGARILGFEEHSEGVDIQFEPNLQAESVRLPVFIVAEKAWGHTVGNGPPVAVAALEQRGKPIGTDIAGAPRGRAVYSQSAARISWWAEGNPDPGAPAEFAWHEPRKDRCFVYGADLWLQTRHLLTNEAPVHLQIRFPGIQALRAFPAVVRATLNRATAAKLENMRGPDAARPSRWRIDCGDSSDGLTPTGVCITPPRVDTSPDPDAPELRLLLRTAVSHRGLCTRLDVADAVNESLGRSELAMTLGLQVTPDTVRGHADFNAANRQISVVWHATVRTAKPKLSAAQQSEIRNLLREIQGRLEPQVPPGTRLQLALDGAHGSD